MKKFIAMFALVAVLFAGIGCGGDSPKKDTPKAGDAAGEKDKAKN